MARLHKRVGGGLHFSVVSSSPALFIFGELLATDGWDRKGPPCLGRLDGHFAFMKRRGWATPGGPLLKKQLLSPLFRYCHDSQSYSDL